MSDAVIFERLVCTGGKQIGIARLNAPKTLNALAFDMVVALARELDTWAKDPDIAVVVLEGEGERAFCAGGDIQTLYRAMLPQPADAQGLRPVPALVHEFFAREYRLDHTVHHYPKPVLCWGDGIVMGGGLGLMMGASHRVVTERSRLAMPEVSIGLFPDVGGSWFLNRVPEGCGLFLAMTGAALGAADALFAGWADHHLHSSSKASLMQALTARRWGDTRLENDAALTELLAGLQAPPEPRPGPLESHLEALSDICLAPTVEDVVAGMARLAPRHAWLASATAVMHAGAPGSVRLAWELLHRSRNLPLADVFRLEYDVVTRCVAQPDIVEGVRALLIDKDRRPSWSPRTLAEADDAWVQRFFVPSSAPHPLADLQD